MAALTRAWIPVHLILLVVAYALLFLGSELPNQPQAILALWIFFPVGILGAIIANATGTGGGVVFVPIFAALQGGIIMIAPEFRAFAELNTFEAVAVSFTIQCFGMSVGAMVWAHAIFVKGALPWNEKTPPQTLQTLVFTPLFFGIPALIVTQQFFLRQLDGDVLLNWFKIASLILGLFLLVFTWVQRNAPASGRTLFVTRVDIYVLMVIGIVGGFVTALFSVGIGEFLAIYLLLRRYPTRIAVAVAVWVSVVCVLVGVWFNIQVGFLKPEVALIAIPGAIIGGFIAKFIATGLGSLWLKTLAALWITLSAIYLLAT